MDFKIYIVEYEMDVMKFENLLHFIYSACWRVQIKYYILFRNWFIFIKCIDFT